MTHDEHETIITNILANLGDQGAVSDYLNTLRNDYTETLTNVDTLTEQNTTLNAHNESLKNVNNKIMLQLGDFSAIVKEEKPKEKEEEKIEESMKFEDLVNNEGELS